MRVASALGLLLTTAFAASAVQEGAPRRPNILWLSSEDNGPHLGAYGDPVADTPSLDALARRGLRYDAVWSNAPVCAPARTTIITGLYATSLGAHHMRSSVRLPAGVSLFPEILRRAGYYTSNNAKLDYNLEGWGVRGTPEVVRRVWSDSSPAAHWRNRPPGAPFFSVFNFGVTHESQIRLRPHHPIHDPASVRLPAYHPDTPEMRRTWAQYYDKMTEMDAQAGARLRELAEDGLADDTIVFYWGDHGIGLPRGKRTPLDSGLRVPLLVYVPPAWAHLASAEYRPGGATARLVSFVDFAPTVLSLAGLEPPGWMQGVAFLGPWEGTRRDYLFGFRGRMDERYDEVRSVRDGRWVYARNYLPHRSYGAHVSYMFETPATREWQRLWQEGELPPRQAFFWEPTKPFEELYDLAADPWEVTNLARLGEHAAVKARLATALDRHLEAVRDLGLLHESEMLARSTEDSPRQMAEDPGRFPIADLMAAGRAAADVDAAAEEDLVPLLSAADAGVRYWGCVGALVRGEPAVALLREPLRALLDDPSPAVRLTAAEALGRYGDAADLQRALRVLLAAASLETQDLAVAATALEAIDALDRRALALLDEVQRLPVEHPKVPWEQSARVPELVDRIVAELSPP